MMRNYKDECSRSSVHSEDFAYTTCIQNVKAMLGKFDELQEARQSVITVTPHEKPHTANISSKQPKRRAFKGCV